MKTAVAFSTFKDTFAGVVTAYLIPFKTKRRGERVTRYRWTTEAGGCGFAPGGFPSMERAIEAVQRHQLMGPVQVKGGVA